MLRFFLFFTDKRWKITTKTSMTLRIMNDIYDFAVDRCTYYAFQKMDLLIFITTACSTTSGLKSIAIYIRCIKLHQIVLNYYGEYE